MEAVMHKSIIAALFSLAAVAAPSAAMAQAAVVYGPPPAVYAGPVTAAEAQDIAAVNGVVAIRKIERDEGLWKIRGRDVGGARVEMKIDIASGAIVQLERYY
jgi:hypothetical protein